MAPGGREQVRLQCPLESLSDRSGDRSAGGRRFHVAGLLTAKLRCPVAVRATWTGLANKPSSSFSCYRCGDVVRIFEGTRIKDLSSSRELLHFFYLQILCFCVFWPCLCLRSLYCKRRCYLVAFSVPTYVPCFWYFFHFATILNGFFCEICGNYSLPSTDAGGGLMDPASGLGLLGWSSSARHNRHWYDLIPPTDELIAVWAKVEYKGAGYDRKFKFTSTAGWPLVWKTWKYKWIWQLSGKCRGFYWSQGSVRKKTLSGKSCLKLFIVSCSAYLRPYRHLVLHVVRAWYE